MSGILQGSVSFWDAIVPKAHLENGSLNPTTRAHTLHSQAYHVDKPMVTPNLFHGEKDRPERTAGARAARPFISLAEQLKRMQAAESARHLDDTRHSGDEVLAPSLTPLPKVPIDEESSEEDSEEPSDSEALDGDDEYQDEDYNNDDCETASDASDTSRPESRLPHRTPRKSGSGLRSHAGTLKDRNKTTAPKRKTAPSRRASANGKRAGKRAKTAAKDDFEQDYQVSENDEDDGDKEDFGMSRDLDRLTQAGARSPESSPSPVLMVPRSHRRRWTKEEEACLQSLRCQGKSWEHIATSVLGRTVYSLKARWRDHSLKPIEARTKGHRREYLSSGTDISAMAKIPSRRLWSKEEDDLLVSLLAKGKPFECVTRYMNGRGFDACNRRWERIKGHYPRGTKPLKRRKRNRKGDLSEREDTHSSTSSPPDQEVEEADSDGTFEGYYPESSRDESSRSDSSFNTPPAKQSFLKAVVIPEKSRSTVADKIPKVAATSTDHNSQLTATNSVAGGRISSTGTNVSLRWDPPNLQPVTTTRDLMTTKKERFNGKGLLLRGFEERETQEPGLRLHRSNSFLL